MAFRTIRRIVLALFLAALCCGIGFFLMITNPSVQHYALNRVSQAMGYDLNTGNIGLSMERKPGIHIQDVQVCTKQGQVLLSASDLTLMPNLSNLFSAVAGTAFSGSVEARKLKFQLAGSGEIKDYNLNQVMFSGNYNLNQRVLDVSSLEITTSGTSLSAMGQVLLPPLASPVLDLTVTSPFMTMDTFKSLLPSLLFPDVIKRELLPVINNGDVRMNAFTLKGGLDQIQALGVPENATVMSLNLALRSMVIQRPDIPEFRDVSCVLSFDKGVFSLENLAGGFGQSVFQNSSIVVPNIYAERIRYRVLADAKLSMQDIKHLKNRSFLSSDVQKQIQAIQVIDGEANIRVAFDIETGQPFPEITTSAITIRNISVVHPLLQLPLMLASGTVVSGPHEPFQFTGDGLWGKSRFQFRGSADNAWEHLSARATTQADVKELFGMVLPQMKIGDWTYGSLDAEGLLYDSCAIIDPARINVGKGYLRFKGKTNLEYNRPVPEMHWVSHIHIVQESAQNLIQLIYPGITLLDGSVSLEGVLTLKNSDGTGVFSGLSGHANLVVEKGWIQQNNSFLSALALLNLEQFFKPGASGVQPGVQAGVQAGVQPGVQNGRLYFDRIEGNIEIEKGKILVQNLTLQSYAANVAVAGTIDLNRDHLQLRIGFQPLGTVDSFVGGIPLIGNILTGKEKALIVYYVEVTGSMSNPQIKTIPLKNLGESALGYVERMVFTPERILKALTSLNDPRPPAPDYHAEFDQIIPAL
jgi:hypothetical protein